MSLLSALSFRTKIRSDYCAKRSTNPLPKIPCSEYQDSSLASTQAFNNSRVFRDMSQVVSSIFSALSQVKSQITDQKCRKTITNHPQAGPETRPVVRPLRFTAHIFKLPESVCMIFGTFQRQFILNTLFTVDNQIYNTKWRNMNFVFDDYYGKFSIKC